MADEMDRRGFLKGMGVVGGASAMAPLAPLAGAPERAAQAEPAAAHPPAAPLFFTAVEAAFVEAVVDRFIPADDLTPSGTDCGVATFIDRQLAGAWGTGDRLYMQGPWQDGTPEQGYQLPLTPAELYRAAIASVNAHCVSALGKEFDRLDEAGQIAVLQGLERGEIALGTVPARTFFEMILANTMEGFFADPIYGGNRDKIAWKMIGYPGVIAVYAEDIKTYRNRQYDEEPTSIQDLA